jgi:hypothetical protein
VVNEPAKRVFEEVPDLRIVPQALVGAGQDPAGGDGARHPPRCCPRPAVLRTAAALLDSGFVKCGACGRGGQRQRKGAETYTLPP